MIFGYVRVSTEKQKTDLQQDAIEAAGCDRIFIEKQSGKSKNRPILAELMSQLRSGDTLIVWKFDRLSRSMKELVTTINDLCERNVHFVSLTESVDSNTPTGRFFFHLIAAMAEFEADIIRERTIEGLNAARARGRKGGRKPKMTKEDIRKASAMLTDPKETKSSVAEHFGVSRVTLNKHLDNKKPA